MAEESISIQGFTRVHMVPRVNQGRTVALAFELPSGPPVAYGAPVQVLQQLFLKIPQVLADARKVRAEAGLVDAPDAPAIASVPWEVESLEVSPTSDTSLNLTVHMKGSRVDLMMRSDQALQLSSLLMSCVAPKPAAKKTRKAQAAPVSSELAAVKRTVAKTPKATPKAAPKTKAKPVVEKKKTESKKVSK